MEAREEWGESAVDIRPQKFAIDIGGAFSNSSWPRPVGTKNCTATAAPKSSPERKDERTEITKNTDKRRIFKLYISFLFVTSEPSITLKSTRLTVNRNEGIDRKQESATSKDA
eukprot:2153180-Amphidinium_carterae.1